MVVLCKYFGLTWGAETNRSRDCVCFANHRILSLGTYCCLSVAREIVPQISLVNIFQSRKYGRDQIKTNCCLAGVTSSQSLAGVHVISIFSEQIAWCLSNKYIFSFSKIGQKMSSISNTSGCFSPTHCYGRSPPMPGYRSELLPKVAPAQSHTSSTNY